MQVYNTNKQRQQQGKQINLEYVNKKIIKVISQIGITAPVILLILSIGLLRKKKIYLLVYLVGYIFNCFLNIALKMLIKEKRPANDMPIFEFELKNNKKRYIFDKYGMPSGHAENCAYSVVFIACVLQNPNIVGIYLLLCSWSVLQRFMYNNHTLWQLFVGLIVGGFIGYITVFTGNKMLKGKMLLRADDYCFV